MSTMRDDRGGERAVSVPRGFGYAACGTTGTIAAALAQNSVVFAARANPANKARVNLENLRVCFTTIVAFTTPITAGRRLAVFRAGGAACTGGAALALVSKDSGNLGPESTPISDVRIATTAALGVAGVAVEANPIGQLGLVHVGAAGAFYEFESQFDPTWNVPVQLHPGELIVIAAPQAFDAAGTWQIAVDARFAVAEELK